MMNFCLLCTSNAYHSGWLKAQKVKRTPTFPIYIYVYMHILETRKRQFLETMAMRIEFLADQQLSNAIVVIVIIFLSSLFKLSGKNILLSGMTVL